MMHPWRLSKGEMRAIAALIEHQTFARASEKLGMNNNAYKAAVQRARKKMGVESTLLAVVKWDRWARSNQKVHESNQALLEQVRAANTCGCSY